MTAGKKMKIYISGKISGNPEYKKQFTQKFRELEEKGFTVLTPLFINCDIEYDDYMHIDYAMIDVCNAVYMMENWKESNGAKLEHEYALKAGKAIYYENK